MSGLAGIVNLDGTPLAPDMLAKMVAAMTYWGPDGVHQQARTDAGFAYFHAINTPEAHYERQPCLLPSGEWLTAVARLDNRDELLKTLRIENGLSATMADGALLGQAYLRWGEAVINSLFGDWSFVVWNPATRRLFLARDQFGNTSLYYHANTRYVAFASSIKALLALDPAFHTIDDLYVAQVILGWPAYHGPRSVHPYIQRLPPAHMLAATPQGSQTRLYWRLGDVKMLPLRSLDEAVEGFRPHFERAVQCRLRSAGPVATTLSGGLDSGSVTALAATLLAAQNHPLIAYTSVPIYNYPEGKHWPGGNEWEMAAATAAFAAITRHYPIEARGVSPLMGIEEMLWTHDAPVRLAGNAYWVVDLLQQAKKDGASLLLMAQAGNATISWTGFFKPKPTPQTDLRQAAKAFLLHYAPLSWSTRLTIWRMNHQDTWLKNTFANADLVRRTRAIEHSFGDRLNILDVVWGSTPLEQRLFMLKAERNHGGASWHERAATFGVEMRDPTQDVRLITYCLSIPNHFFTDPETGMNRMLIRQAMTGKLPEDVRLNQIHGVQAADLIARLCADHTPLTNAITHFAQSPAADYLNLNKMHQTWTLLQEGKDRLQNDANLLLRAVMAGFFVERPHYPRPRPTATLAQEEHS